LKTLLQAVKAELGTRMTGMRAIDIFITPHTNLIPAGTQFPAIGIKDGAVKRHELAGGDSLDRDLIVSLIPYVKAYPGEKSIIGSGVFKGILDIVEDIHEILDDNFLGIDGMEAAFCEDENESEMFGNPEDGLQRKIIKYKYERRSER
jgi:hypothetical protein